MKHNINTPKLELNPYAEKKLNLFYLREFGNILDSSYNYLDYIHKSRSKNFTDAQKKDAEKLYNGNLNKCIDDVKKIFSGKSYNAIISAPSSTDMHKPFYDTIKRVAEDKHSFTFNKTKRTGECKTFEEYYMGFEIIEPCEMEISLNNILIVDDMYARGWTTGAIIKKLGEYKVTSGNIFVFTPLVNGENIRKIKLPEELKFGKAEKST